MRLRRLINGDLVEIKRVICSSGREGDGAGGWGGAVLGSREVTRK